MDFGGSWEDHLHLVELAYNNSFQASIGMDPYEALYVRPCRSPLCWVEAGESTIVRSQTESTTGETIMEGHELTGWSLGQDGYLLIEGTIYISAAYREEVLREHHTSRFDVHLGSTKMYNDLKRQYRWAGMKRHVAEMIVKCLTC